MGDSIQGVLSEGHVVGVRVPILPKRMRRSFTGEVVNHTKKEKLRK